MIGKISEIKSALKHEEYQAALALSLTLPDICSQVENYTMQASRKLYIKWFDDHVDLDSFHISGLEKWWIELLGKKYAIFDGEICYALRCRFLHNGSDDAEKAKKVLPINKFSLLGPNSLGERIGFSYRYSKDNTEMRVDINYLCVELCRAAESFYESWSNKEDFNSHDVVFN